MTNIFEYSNISDPNIYSDIRSYQNFDTNIFVYSFVSKNFIRIYSDIRSCHFLDTNIFGYSFVSKSIRMSHSGPDLKAESKNLAKQPPKKFFKPLGFRLKFWPHLEGRTAPKRQKCLFTSAKKWHFERPDLRTESKNLAKHPPKWLGRHLGHAFSTFGWVLSQFLKIAF